MSNYNYARRQPPQLPGMPMPPELDYNLPQPAPTMYSQGQGMPQLQPPPDPAAAAAAQPGAPGKGLNEQSVAAMMALSGMKTQQAAIERQRKMADLLRAEGTKQLQGTQAGRVYVAPGYGSLLGNFASQAAGLMGDMDAKQQSDALAGDEREAQRAFYEGITGKTMPQRPPPNPYAGAGGGGAGFMDWLKGAFGGGGAGS
ncbi:hypothetical protein GCM10028796_46690 [Ramlibacter monticola]|uniref:Uncharacterized protein n=1 Tax=Ramlibacter monticola TaxID=1926872 RepID=A0A937CW97_9BURK|nr:hypothetical protein [Ramlibacter monticola]MBL0394294.1 hypothetical protein [Ramlibacter monticola]